MSKNNKSLKNLLTAFLIALSTIAGFAVINVCLLISAAYYKWPTSAMLALSIILVCLIVSLIVIATLLLSINKKVYYDNLYKTIRNNLETVANRKKDIKLHSKNTDVAEIEELNQLLDKTMQICEQTIVYNKIINYEEMGINFINNSSFLCEYSSLTKNIPSLILNNEMFRCAFIDFYYDLGKAGTLSNKDRDRLCKEIIAGLGYDNILLAPHESSNNPGILAYIPHIESISQISEEVDLLLRQMSIIRPTETSYEVVMAHASVVAYPYSEVNSIMADLNYATRQNKILNVFLPPYHAKQNNNLLQSNMNLANVTRFLTRFASLSFDEKDLSGNSKKIDKVLAQVADYYGFDTSGLIYYNDALENYSVVYQYSKDGLDLFDIDQVVDTQFIKTIDQVKDEDLSFYFSSRDHVNSILVGYLDYYLISSGQFYVIRDSNTIYGLVYFLNRNKPLNLDAYLREGLLTFSYFISAYSREILTRMNAKNSDTRFNDIVKITNTKVYSINKESHSLVYASDALKDIKEGIELRKPCYKVLYGLTSPCKDCPLTNKNRKLSTFANVKYETSVAIKHNEDNTVIMKVEEHNDRFATKDRFDPILLINSYASYVERINYAFIDGTNGYTLLLVIDNIKKLIEEQGNEGYATAIKDFTNRITNKIDHINNVYLYRDDVLALVLPDADRNTIINDVENIYLLSKEVMIDDVNYPLSISYVTHKYLGEYKGVTDYVSTCDKKLLKFRKEEGLTDYLYFTETGYSRHASKEDFYLDVIDNALIKSKYGVRLQPEIDMKRHVIGAETLMRLTDTYRNINLPIGQVIAVGEKHGKINLITDALLKTIGDLYRDNGYQTFKTSGLSSISINTNFDYLDSDNLLAKLGTLAKTYSIPKDFLALEFAEEDVAAHKANIAQLSKTIRSCDVMFICDHYTGNKISPEELKEFGFAKVKLDYSIIRNITTYKTDLDRVQFLSRAASDIGVRPVLIGIEDALQYELVKDSCGDFLVQGELFAGPLEAEEFIKTLKKMNK